MVYEGRYFDVIYAITPSSTSTINSQPNIHRATQYTHLALYFPCLAHSFGFAISLASPYFSFLILRLCRSVKCLLWTNAVHVLIEWLPRWSSTHHHPPFPPTPEHRRHNHHHHNIHNNTCNQTCKAQRNIF